MNVGNKITGGVQHPFISPKDVGKRATFTIETVGEAPKAWQYSDIAITLVNGKNKYSWGLGFDTVAAAQLMEKFGEETDDWQGEKITLTTVEGVAKRGKNKGKKTTFINVA